MPTAAVSGRAACGPQAGRVQRSAMGSTMPAVHTAPQATQQCPHTPAACPNPVRGPTRAHHQRLPRQQQCGALWVCAAQQTSTSTAATSGLGLFPAGKQQARVQLPALMLQVDVQQVLNNPAILDTLGEALQGGCNGVVLWDESNVGAAGMYDAALRIQEQLRDRAALLLVDRTDIAMAVAADGVVLTDQGVPTVVARRMVSAAKMLVGRVVADADTAITAAADGANLLLFTGLGGAAPAAAALEAAKSKQRSGSAIPIIVAMSASSISAPSLTGVLAARPDGIAATPALLGAVAASCGAPGGGVAEQAAAVMARLSGQAPAPPAQEQQQQQPATNGGAAAADAAAPTDGTAGNGASAAAAAPVKSPVKVPGKAPAKPAPTANRPLWRLLDAEREKLLAEEKLALDKMLSFLEQVLPAGTGELQLLRDALKALDDAFLVAVVGEFNSGKSSVINAMLGGRFLAEGILPTTNEISVLRYEQPGPNSGGKDGRLEQQADGLYVRYLPARLLQDVAIVDTPGTNVILERQQRLTEEYVPRADLVLFVMSADRPFSESEVRFLEYIRGWRKKVVFVVNKVDILASPQEVEQVKDFVAANAQRILRLDRPSVIAVSSRFALSAKLAVPATSDGPDEAALERSAPWRSSNFQELEKHIANFLVGKGEGGGEGVRLKLQTPLFVADALLGAAGRQLAADLAAARAELEGVQLVGRQLGRFKAEMDKDARAQQMALGNVLGEVLERTNAFVDATIQMSNAPMLVSLATGNKQFPFRAKFEKEVVGGSVDTLRAAVAEHSAWLRANCDNQMRYYRDFAAARQQALGVLGAMSSDDEVPAPSVSNPSAVGERTASGALATTSAGAVSAAGVALEEFNTRAVASLLDQELQQVMMNTAGTAVGAPVVGLFATEFFGSTLEDLMAVTVGGVVSYVALLNLPLRRSEIKQKAATVANNFVADVQAKMAEEASGEVGKVMATVAGLMAPLEAAYAAEVARLEAREAQLARYAADLQDLQRRTANLE